MSRFEKLELGSTSELQPKAERHPPVSGEKRCLSQAREAFEQGDFEPALRFFARALEHNSQSIDAWIGQVQALIEIGQFKEAKVWADKALEQFSRSPELLSAKAVALGRLGETETAISFSDAALTEPGETPYVWLARADVLLSGGRQPSDACFQRALQLAPGDWFIRWMAGRIRAFWKQFAIALKLTQEALTLAPDRYVLWILAGQCQTELGLKPAAQISFAQALTFRPGATEAVVGQTRNREMSWWREWFARLFRT